MKSNSNFNITKTVVDPTSQQLTAVYINGESFSPGSPSPATEYEDGWICALRGTSADDYDTTSASSWDSIEAEVTTPVLVKLNESEFSVSEILLPSGYEGEWKRYKAEDFVKAKEDVSDCGYGAFIYETGGDVYIVHWDDYNITASVSKDSIIND